MHCFLSLRQSELPLVWNIVNIIEWFTRPRRLDRQIVSSVRNSGRLLNKIWQGSVNLPPMMIEIESEGTELTDQS
jgi:hypothetical protein